MEGNSVIFEHGWPYVGRKTDEISYCFPNKRFSELFEKTDKSDIVNFILEGLKKQLQEFGVFTSIPPYPYIQQGQHNGFTLHIGDGGRWISVWRELGEHFIMGHNLDSYLDRLVAFNTGSDILKKLNPSFKAPRVSVKSDKVKIAYPLPAGSKVLPIERNKWFYSGEGLEKYLEITSLGKIKERTYEQQRQRISCEKGTITIKDGLCIGEGFEGWTIPDATFIMAKLLDAGFTEY